MKLITRLLATAWGKVRRTPRLPSQFSTGGEVVGIEPRTVAWADYDALMASHPAYPGWTFCRFGVRGPRAEDHSEVQGIVSAPFGAWWSPFLCIDDRNNDRASHGLACLEHTRTGMAIGVFANMDVAVEAAEIAMRMADWQAFNFDDTASMALIMRVRAAWAAADISMAPFHAYPMVRGEVPQGMPPVSIFAKVMQDEQRPARLS